ncbi:LPS O-antigen length regulator [Vibrio parahaemolyticus]|nr:LPS O-antigen length regulator [Vibrio parahaemolyticus]MBM4866724.1 LPS O-antigen length regulator [Vibrio parahaemolyticus]MBM4885994.1 LPS O-antigen length regulator [Vibrio parahaemolyticus]
MEPQKESPQHYLPYPTHSQQSADDEIDLHELFAALWKGKWIIVATTFALAIGSVFYALNLPDIYKADALLAPAESSNSGGLSKMAGQFGGIAALAGVNIGGSELSQADLAIQIMKSRQFIENFIEKNNLLLKIMAVKEWSIKDNELILDDEIYNSKTEKWLRERRGLRGPEPSSLEAYERFHKDILSIEFDDDIGLYTISVKYYSPFIAKEWVDLLVKEINKVMRERTIAETNQNLKYLNAQLQKTPVADMQSTFYQLIEEQTKSLMLAEVQDEFTFKVIDPPVVPEIKYGPKRALICILGTLFGGILGCIIVILSSVLRKKN